MSSFLSNNGIPKQYREEILYYFDMIRFKLKIDDKVIEDFAGADKSNSFQLKIFDSLSFFSHVHAIIPSQNYPYYIYLQHFVNSEMVDQIIVRYQMITDEKTFDYIQAQPLWKLRNIILMESKEFDWNNLFSNIKLLIVKYI